MPVTDEPLGAPDAYGDDRVFCYLRDMDEPNETLDEQVKALAAAGQPTVTLSARRPGRPRADLLLRRVRDRGRRLGAARSTRSTSPTSRRPRTTTSQILGEIEGGGELHEPEDAGDDALRALLGAAPPGDYVALLGFMAPSARRSTRRSRELRAAIRDATRATTTFGYGPRYLHSTGQLHKGGPASGPLPRARRTTATRTSRSPAGRSRFGR